MRWVLALALLGGCDYLFQLDTVPLADGGAGDADAAPAVPIAFVQAIADNTVGQDDTRAAVLPADTRDGDLIVAFIAWGFTFSGVASVTDTQGNTYVVGSQSSHQIVYYAENIHGGPTTVTVKFANTTDGPDLRVLEYTGIARDSSLEKAAEQSGAGTDIDSGPLQTKHAYDLIVAGTSVQGATIGPGPGYMGRLLTPGNGSLAEDTIVTSPGTYTATAMQNGSDGDFLAIDAIAFRGAADAPP